MRPFIVVLAAALIALTGCGSSANSNGASSSSGRDAAVARAPKPVGGGGTTGQAVRLAPAQAIVYTADLSMRATDVTHAAAEATRIVAAAGGYVGNENATDDGVGSHPSATITFKIPSAGYQRVLDQLDSSAIGTRLSLHQQADDVTQEVADVASRVKSAQATLASFRKLQAKAQNIDDIVQLEQEISSREADLESLQARQKSLNAQTSYATVTLRLSGPVVKSHAREKAGGFTGGASSGWHAFTAFVGGLALVFGWLLPFLALAALLGLPALWVWRRRRRSAPSGTG